MITAGLQNNYNNSDNSINSTTGFKPHLSENTVYDHKLQQSNEFQKQPQFNNQTTSKAISNEQEAAANCRDITESIQFQEYGKTPFVIEWLQETYEPFEGISLPRSNLYSQYVEFCRGCHVDPVNAASFGKIIRAVFPTLKTRRLGTRGNSKYHYYGIRLKSDPAGGGAVFDPNAFATANGGKNYSRNSTVPIARKCSALSAAAAATADYLNYKKNNLSLSGADFNCEFDQSMKAIMLERIEDMVKEMHTLCIPNTSKIPNNFQPDTISLFTNNYISHCTKFLAVIYTRDYAGVNAFDFSKSLSMSASSLSL